MDVFTHSILPFVFILVGLVVVHELGHFFTAKLAGVQVLEFGVGYPPKLFGKKFGETEYTINALPLGGFVRLLGEEDPTAPRSLASKPRWVRLIVLSSGAFMNLIFAVVLFSIALMIPREVDISRARVGEVVPNSPAAAAGILPGDVVFEVDGRNVQNLGELGYLIRLNMGNTIDMKVKHSSGPNANEFETIPVRVRWSAPDYVDEDGVQHGQGPTGITIGPAYGAIQPISLEDQEKIREQLEPGETVPTTRLVPFSETQWSPPWEALPEGARKSWESVILARNEIISRFRGGVGGDGGFQVTGPVGIAQLTGEVVEEAGWKSLLDFAALISMNQGVLNLLPLPMLDGGRVVFVLLEYVRRGKRVAPEKEAMVHFVGLVLMLTFAAVISYFDIVRIFEGGSILK